MRLVNIGDDTLPRYVLFRKMTKSVPQTVFIIVTIAISIRMPNGSGNFIVTIPIPIEIIRAREFTTKKNACSV